MEYWIRETELLLYFFEASVVQLQANPILPNLEKASEPEFSKLQVRAFPTLAKGLSIFSYSYSTLYTL